MALAVARFDPYLFTGGDNAHYYALARALATGRGYVDLVAPGAPPHTQYPPGFPALLVPLYLLSGGSYVALKLTSLVAGGVLLAALYRLARRDPALPTWTAAAAVWMVGLYTVFQLYAHRVLSDMTYAALVVASLAVFQRGAEDDSDRIDPTWFAGCILALAAFYVRSAGVTLLAAVIVWALVRYRWRRAALAAVTFVVGGAPWVAWSRLAGNGPGGYVAELTSSNPFLGGGSQGRLAAFVDRLGDTVIEYATFQFPHLFWPVDPAPGIVRVAAVVVGGSLLAYGAWAVLRARGVAPWDLYVAWTLVLLPFWPWLGDRYFLTLAPFLWLYLLTGLDGACARAGAGRKLAVVTVGALALGLVVAGAVAGARQWERTRAWLAGDEFAGYSPFWGDYFRSARWIGENAPADAIVLARKPTLAWYWSGRPAVRPPRGGDADARWRAIREQGVTHILLESATEARLEDVLHPRVGILTVVHETPRREVVVLGLPPRSDPGVADRP